MTSAFHNARLVNCASAPDKREVTLTVEVEGGQRLNLQLGSDEALGIARYVLLAQQVLDAARPGNGLALGTQSGLPAAARDRQPAYMA